MMEEKIFAVVFGLISTFAFGVVAIECWKGHERDKKREDLWNGFFEHSISVALMKEAERLEKCKREVERIKASKKRNKCYLSIPQCYPEN